MHLLVLSAFRRTKSDDLDLGLIVSMHLLVLSAFRRKTSNRRSDDAFVVSMHLLVLSAFRPGAWRSQTASSGVSMHLLVLSAFRRWGRSARARPASRSQCTFWCSVLSDLRCGLGKGFQACLNAPFGAQCFPTMDSFCVE